MLILYRSLAKECCLVVFLLLTGAKRIVSIWWFRENNVSLRKNKRQ